MSLRPTTVRRLAVLVAGLVMLVAIGASLYLRNERHTAARLAAARRAGMTAFVQGDYRAALDDLQLYIPHARADADALYAYGVSRARVEAPNGANISEAISIFTNLLQLNPANLPAKHRLLDLYTQAYYSNEAIDLADRLLSEHPDDRDALHAKCAALMRLHKNEAALAISSKLNALDPTDIEQQLTTYRLMRDLNRPDAQLIERAVALQKSHANDPRFELLLGWVYGNCGDNSHCVQWLRTAATQPVPDAIYVRYMVSVLDQLKLFRESQAVLDRAVQQNPNPRVLRVLIQRLWQNGRDQEVINRLKNIASPENGDAGLLAYKALSLHDIGDVASARQIAAALAARSGDNDALAWAIGLSTYFGQCAPQAALAQYQAALARAPDNAVIRFLVGQTYARMGETDLAMTAWKHAAELSPSWVTPHLEIAHMLADTGRLGEAIDEATAAYRAAPDRLSTLAALASIRYKAVQASQPAAPEESSLLAMVEQVQHASPGEAQTIVPYVDLLARAGRTSDAIAAARKVLANPNRYDETTILQLMSVSRAHHLGIDRALSMAAGSEDRSPRIALAKAIDLAATGNAPAGMELLRERSAAATTQPVEWKLAIARYEETTNDPSAAQDWMALGDANPKDLTVQQSILKQAASARANRDFIARTIDRLRALTGAEGQTWRMERARWLIGSGAPKDAAEAVNTLSEIVRTAPTLVEARLLLAQAFETVGNFSAAVDDLQAANERNPNRPEILLEMVRALQASARSSDARTLLDQLVGEKSLTSDQRRETASLLAAQGDFEPAAKLLESTGDLGTSGQLLLAELDRALGKPDAAGAVYAKLLSQHPPSVDTIAAAASFDAARGKMDQAHAVLAWLPEAMPRPGQAALVRANFSERWETPDAALNEYLAATRAAPADPQSWQGLIEFQMRRGHYDEAVKYADMALHAAPDDPTLTRLRASADTLAHWVAGNSAERRVIDILADDVNDRGVQTLLASPDPTSQPSSLDMLDRLKDAASNNPHSRALQAALVECHIVRGELMEASDAAQHLMRAFPGDVSAARSATEIDRKADRLDQAEEAARQWRKLSADNPMPATLSLADIELSRGDAPAALKVLEPYAHAATANPQSNSAVAAILIRADVAAGDEQSARQIIDPLLAKDRRWRLLALRIAGENEPQADLAEAWIREVEPMLVDDGERAALGEAWYRIAARFHRNAALVEAAKALDPIVARANAPADAILLRAAVADRAGDVNAAEAGYRRGLKLDPQQPDALNNLAYLVLQTGDAAEARSLAEQAVRLSPTNANYYDTLARAQAKAGDRAGALQSFHKAIELKPDNLAALIGLAHALQSAGQPAPATKIIAQIDQMMKTDSDLSPALAQELEAVRAAQSSAHPHV